QAARGVAGCPGDCGNDGEVTVNELVLGVNIALDNAPLDQCQAFDTDGSGDVTINEIIAAVSSALNGCNTFAGHYQSTVALDGGRTGTMDLTVQPDGGAMGELVISGGPRGLPAIAGVSLSGSVNFSTGQFSVTGSYVDGSGHTLPVNVSGTLPVTIG